MLHSPCIGATHAVRSQRIQCSPCTARSPCVRVCRAGKHVGENGAVTAELWSGEVGPPFRSQSDRRQWLLQEKRRWLVEMRLGNIQPEPAAAVSRLPPISPAAGGGGGATLSNGMNVDALATPRALV